MAWVRADRPSGSGDSVSYDSAWLNTDTGQWSDTDPNQAPPPSYWADIVAKAATLPPAYQQTYDADRQPLQADQVPDYASAMAQTLPQTAYFPDREFRPGRQVIDDLQSRGVPIYENPQYPGLISTVQHDQSWQQLPTIDWNLYEKTRGTTLAALGHRIGSGIMLGAAGGAALGAAGGGAGTAGGLAGGAEGIGLGATAGGAGGATLGASGGAAAGGTAALAGGAAGGLAGLAQGGAADASGTMVDGATSGGISGGAAGGAAAGTAISRILDGTATTADYLSLAGNVGLTGLGIYGANKQANALEDLNNQYMAMGAPSRGRYESSFAPGFTMENDPGYTDALGQAAKSTLHGMSAKFGNPSDSPNAWAATLKDLYAGTAYPALQDYRKLNANTGGLSRFAEAAPGVATGAINADAGKLNAIGAGAANIFNPPSTLEQLLRGMRAYG